MTTQGPYVSIATFCEKYIEDKSNVLSLIRLVDRLQITGSSEEMPPHIPDWYLVLVLKSGSTKGTYQISIQVEEPSGLTQPGDKIFVPVHFEGGNRGVQIITKIAFPLKMPGIYWFKVMIGDILLTQIPLEVIYLQVSPHPSAQK